MTHTLLIAPADVPAYLARGYVILRVVPPSGHPIVRSGVVVQGRVA